jgi:hypothetical protein
VPCPRKGEGGADAVAREGSLRRRREREEEAATRAAGGRGAGMRAGHGGAQP